MQVNSFLMQIYPSKASIKKEKWSCIYKLTSHLNTLEKQEQTKQWEQKKETIKITMKTN